MKFDVKCRRCSPVPGTESLLHSSPKTATSSKFFEVYRRCFLFVFFWSSVSAYFRSPKRDHMAVMDVRRLESGWFPLDLACIESRVSIAHYKYEVVLCRTERKIKS